ncbi:ABC transporter ATP-binding protein [Luteimonas sp. M1R5S18]|uniref:ABC transporter ATP-binding protein n=1 Tax=Luteimonas rhizosphaericola TaxID=3042024 RepID=A0ABT6JKC2_9GAMM|nr:ABC transporter ATP-binding protein [Luteimonas rhizosphaericola]MDH5831124.1 ABC transporter ATP-binding protein [Luteimonas rhizosphaericola]
MLETRALCKRYGDQIALDALDLKVDSGEVVCLLGANGAGKTTTLNLLLGFLAPTSGEARVEEVVVQSDPQAARARLGYLPEVVQLYPLLSGLETLRYFADLSGRPRPADDELHRMLSQVGLQRDAHGRRVAGYSKGMRQKLGLAIALSKGARALLLDEPLSGLDPKAANELVALVRRLAADGHAVLAVTHDIFRAQQMADRIGIMRQGRLVDMLDPRAMSAAEIEALYVHHLRDVA